MKDRFYFSGSANSFECNCDICPFWKVEDNRMICQETEKNVTDYVIHGKINHECPFLTK